MKQVIKILSLIGLSGLILAGCASNKGTTLGDDATPFTRAEIYNYLSDNTQSRGEGGIYYSSAGTLETIIDGAKAVGEWATYDGGKLCREIEGVEGESCETYYHNGDVVSIEVDGAVSLAPELLEGNTVIVKEMFTPEQTLELVSGNTVLWPPNGGAYYAPDGTAHTVWDGVKEDGSWEINEAGELCRHIPSWGKEPCEAYYMTDEGLRVIYDGKDTEADEYAEGNAL